MYQNRGDEHLSRPVKVTLRDAEWFDPLTQTFLLDEMPSEIKNLIKQIGWKRKDLLSPLKAKQIYDVLCKYGLDQIEQKSANEIEEEKIQHQYSEIQASSHNFPDFNGPGRMHGSESRDSFMANTFYNNLTNRVGSGIGSGSLVVPSY